MQICAPYASWTETIRIEPGLGAAPVAVFAPDLDSFIRRTG